MGTGPFFVSHRAEVTALAAKAKLPALYGIRELLEGYVRSRYLEDHGMLPPGSDAIH